ncbi:ABC transporter permease subunit, partial [Klebsiella pneumoniae]|nr:ABC transporter permease subunit [Klebsiella pneumoniae]
LLGLLAGIFSAIRQFSWSDRTLTLAVLLGISMPSFWIGLLMIMVFSVQLQWFPASGMYDIWQGGGFSDLLHHLVLPVITLSLVATG